MSDKLILPTEVRVCATCSYWDGERRVDIETRLVVVASACEGECLAQEKRKPALQEARQEIDCLWDAVD